MNEQKEKKSIELPYKNEIMTALCVTANKYKKVKETVEYPEKFQYLLNINNIWKAYEVASGSKPRYGQFEITFPPNITRRLDTG